MNRNRFLITVGALILLSNVYSQTWNNSIFEKGLIILKNKDTIKCWVPLSSDYGKIIDYKLLNDDNLKKIQSNLIQRLVTPYNIYENITIGKKEKFMRLLSQGTISLYVEYNSMGPIPKPEVEGFKSTSYRTTKTFVIKKDNEVAIISDLNSLFSYINDCQSLIDKLNKKLYQFKDMETIINEYNKCLRQ